jgi:hypothetical protein
MTWVDVVFISLWKSLLDLLRMMVPIRMPRG